MSLHQGSGHCDYCQSIFNRYSNFNALLRGWFESLQAAHPEAHISSAGRGRVDQEAYFHRGASRAHYGQSAHNYNAAIDIFRMALTVEEMYDKKWFTGVVAPALTEYLEWYGKPGAKFYELPHVELLTWGEAVKNGSLFLVE